MLQHSISLYLGETTLTEPGGVFFRFLSSRKADGVPPTELEPEGMLGH